MNKLFCSYCVKQLDPKKKNVEWDKDHVFAKGLWAGRIRPTDKKSNPKVPTCKECHSNYNKYEEYFRSVMWAQRDGNHLTNTIIRSWQRHDGGHKKKWLTPKKWVDIETLSGLYIGKKLAFNIDMKYGYIPQKIVMGLFCLWFDHPLPADHIVIVMSPLSAKSAIKNNILQFPSFPYETTDGLIKIWSNKQLENDISEWFFFFDNILEFVAFTWPIKKPEKFKDRLSMIWESY